MQPCEHDQRRHPADRVARAAWTHKSSRPHRTSVGRRPFHAYATQPAGPNRRPFEPAICSSSQGNSDDPATAPIAGDITVRRSGFDNIAAVLKAGDVMAYVVRTTVYWPTERRDGVNEITACTSRAVSDARHRSGRPLTRDVRIEIDAIAAYLGAG